MIRELNNLAVLEKANTGPLAAIGFDLSLLDTAATAADKMADLPATANGDKAEKNESKSIRDKACIHLFILHLLVTKLFNFLSLVIVTSLFSAAGFSVVSNSRSRARLPRFHGVTIFSFIF